MKRFMASKLVAPSAAVAASAPATVCHTRKQRVHNVREEQ